MKVQPRTFTAIAQAGALHLTAPVGYREHCAKFGDGEEVEIVVQLKSHKRTDAQNRGFHAMVTPWAEQEGHEIDDLKLDLLGQIFGWSEKPSPLTGQHWPLKSHTSDLTVEEFSTLIDRTLQIAAECGVVLVAPDEYSQQQADGYRERGEPRSMWEG